MVSDLVSTQIGTPLLFEPIVWRQMVHEEGQVNVKSISPISQQSKVGYKHHVFSTSSGPYTTSAPEIRMGDKT